VRLTGEPGDLLLDPYDHGGSVHEEDCRRMIELTSGGMVPYDPSMIRSLGKRDMIARLLFNLKVACLKAGDDQGALASVERLLLLHPDDPPELRDRGLLLYRMDRYREARASLEHYLRALRGSDPCDRAAGRGRPRPLRRWASSAPASYCSPACSRGRRTTAWLAP